MFRFEYLDPADMMKPLAELELGECFFTIREILTVDEFGAALMSQNGHQKIKLKVEVIDSKGNKGMVYEDISAKMPYRIKGWLEAVGLDKMYNSSGCFEEKHLLQQKGRCVLGTKPKQDGSGVQVLIVKLHPRSAFASPPHTVNVGGVDVQTVRPIDNEVPF